jgi:vacuolar-type H+-ATPase subunit F/Vma7
VDVKYGCGILTMIASLHPSGLYGFIEEGGTVDMVCSPSNDIVIYYPDLSETFKEAIKRFEKKDKCHIVFLDQPNFKDLPEEEINKSIKCIQNHFMGHLDTRMTVLDTSNLIIIAIPSVPKKDTETINSITDLLRSINGLHLSYVFLKDTWFKVTSGVTKTVTVTEKKEHGLITSDDLLDLHKGLEQAQNVDDIINNM